MGYDYEKYGFPVSQLRNHSGAINYPDELDIYLEAELARHSIAGPFLSPPFSGRMAISPLNSVPKKDSAERRIILDLSWPLNTSVNIGIDKSLHEGLSLKRGTGNRRIGEWEWGTGNGERGIFKSGNL